MFAPDPRNVMLQSLVQRDKRCSKNSIHSRNHYNQIFHPHFVVLVVCTRSATTNRLLRPTQCVVIQSFSSFVCDPRQTGEKN